MATQQDELLELQQLEELEALEKLSQQEQALVSSGDEQFKEITPGSLLEAAKLAGEEALLTGETLSRGALAGATLGASEPVISGINALLAGGVDPEAFSEAYAADVARRAQMKQERPYSELLGQLAGGITGPVGKVGGMVAQGAVELAKKAPTLPVLKQMAQLPGAETAGRLATGAVAGLSQTPLAATQLEVEKAAGVVPPEQAPDLLDLMKFGAGIGTAIPAAQMVGSSLKKAGSAAMTAVLGPNEKIRQAYLAQPELASRYYDEAQKALAESDALKESRPLTQVSEEIIAATKPAREALESSVAQLETAKVAQTEAKQSFDQAVRDRRFQLEQELKEKTETAAQAAKAKKDFFKAGLGEEFADDVKVAAGDLKQQVIDGSKKAYAILDKQPGNIVLGDIGSDIALLKGELQTGEEILGSAKQAVARKIDYWAQSIPRALGNRTEVPARTVKQIIQDIDTELRYMTEPDNRANFSELDRLYTLKIRRLFDDRLKEISEYAEAMTPVAYKQELLTDVANVIGNEKRTNLVARLNRAWTPGDPAQDVIVRLGRETGRPFEETLAEYAAKKQVGASQAELAKALKELPESKELSTARSQMEILRRKESQQILAPQEYTTWIKTQADVDALNEAIARQQQALAELGSAAKEATTTSFVEQVMKGKNPILDRQLKALQALSGQDFERKIKAAQTAEALMRPYRQGSQRTILVGALSGLMSSIFGASAGGYAGAAAGGIGGGSLGTLAGSILDTYGGAVTKKVLDGYLKIKAFPTVQAVEAAFTGIPDELKKQIVGSFVRAVMNSKRENVPISDDVIPVAMSIIQQSDGLTPLEKARAGLLLQKTGIIDTAVVQQMMLNGKMATPKRSIAFDAIKAERNPAAEADRPRRAR